MTWQSLIHWSNMFLHHRHSYHSFLRVNQFPKSALPFEFSKSHPTNSLNKKRNGLSLSFLQTSQYLCTHLDQQRLNDSKGKTTPPGKIQALWPFKLAPDLCCDHLGGTHNYPLFPTLPWIHIHWPIRIFLFRFGALEIWSLKLLFDHFPLEQGEKESFLKPIFQFHLIFYIENSHHQNHPKKTLKKLAWICLTVYSVCILHNSSSLSSFSFGSFHNLECPKNATKWNHKKKKHITPKRMTTTSKNKSTGPPPPNHKDQHLNPFVAW